ncbi:hypothetical protein KI387_001152, partial [Taxus chinensis]
ADMKFCKRYREFMQGRQDRLPGVSFKKFKKVLKRCTVKYHNQGSKLSIVSDRASSSGDLDTDDNREGDSMVISYHTCCPVCDQIFFPSLLVEMDAVVCCFNARAKQLLELHLASGFQKYLKWMTNKLAGNELAMIQEGKNLVSYASINALAICKILKKYDKIHFSKQGREFRTRAQTMQMEILQSPWLNELIAFHMNLMNDNNNTASVSGDWSLTFDCGKPSLSCTLLDSRKLDIDLTCSICLETLFDPISLKCGHIFCYSCACAAASVTIIEGLESADLMSKCPLCRQRLQSERVERLQQAKKHWEDQCRAIMGL